MGFSRTNIVERNEFRSYSLLAFRFWGNPFSARGVIMPPRANRVHRLTARSTVPPTGPHSIELSLNRGRAPDEYHACTTFRLGRLLDLFCHRWRGLRFDPLP